jgi:hypothetical protein
MWQHEPCFYGWVEGKPPTLRPAVSGENSTVWTIDGEQDGIHPTQKPLAIAAAKTGRRCNAMELAPEFVDVARIRWTNFARAAGLEPGTGALEPSTGGKS